MKYRTLVADNSMCFGKKRAFDHLFLTFDARVVILNITLALQTISAACVGRRADRSALYTTPASAPEASNTSIKNGEFITRCFVF